MANTPMKKTESDDILLTQEAIKIEIPICVLRKIEPNDDHFIDVINKHLKFHQLKDEERLKVRVRNEIYRVRREYRSIKGGNKKSLFDKKIKAFTVYENEIRTFPKHSNEQSVLSPVMFTPPPDLSNSGRIRIDNSSKKNRHRVVRKLEETSEKALGFIEIFGVIPKQLVCETFSGDECIVNVNGTKSVQKSYENMPSVEKENVKSMLNICDSTMISDKAYHEIAMKVPSMPRTHHLISCRNEINEQFDIKRTPGMLPGSYLSLLTEINSYLQNVLTVYGSLPQSLKLKVSGDGAAVSRVSNFVVISYSVLDESTSSSSHNDQHVLAIVNCPENYSNLQHSLGPLFDEINDIHSKGYIQFKETEIPVQLFVGEDMKFIQLLMGLNSSIANYACPWCKVSKETRGDISFPCRYYHSSNMKRTVTEMKTLASSASSKNRFGTKQPPLINIEPENYIPDELHLMMRVTDILLRNLIDDANSKDQFAKISGGATDNLALLIKAIQDCGCNFRTWTSKSGEMDYTSLSGNDKKKLMKFLPEKLLFCLHEETRKHTIQLWREIYELYTLINRKGSEQFQIEEVFILCHTFLENFLSLGQKKREGYHPKNVTPYLHALLYHVPYFLSKHGRLSKFSGQGVEKTNDIIKTIHQVKSNKLDATKDALLVRKRMELGNLHGDMMEVCLQSINIENRLLFKLLICSAQHGHS